MEIESQLNNLKSYSLVCKNIAEQSENKIHSDDVARKYGFSGALISGVAVFAYMTHPLVRNYGESFLKNHQAEVTFFKPAYHGDRLSIDMAPGPGREEKAELVVTARNEEGTELSRLKTFRPETMPEPDPHAELSPTPMPEENERTLVDWDLLELERPFWPYHWHPGIAENQAWCDSIMERLPLYRTEDAPLHPGYILQACNVVFKTSYLLPAWIHVSSQITFRDIMRVGQAVEVMAVPIEKFEKKGHKFTTLYITFRVDGKLMVEVKHTAIIRIAEKSA